MPANMTLEETKLLEDGISSLQGRLPTGWTISKSTRTVPGPIPSDPQTRVDRAVDLKGPQSSWITFVVEAKRIFQPRDVERIVPPGVSQTLRSLSNNTPILVIAPWLSPRTQELLSASNINYVDLTGNIRITVEYPVFYFQTAGATRDPNPPERPVARVRGPKAARLVRLLADVKPPYGVREIAQVANLNPGYVSKLLDTLDSEALIDRSTRGQVSDIDYAKLLRRWTESYEVFKTNDVITFLSPQGAETALQRLSSLDIYGRAVVTGSFAAVRRAPVAAPAMLLAYCKNIGEVAKDLELLPATSGANVALLTPVDDVVWERTQTVDGVLYAADSQVVVDCLTGNGRMPAEGEALLSWMVKNESIWRASSINALQLRDTE